MPKHRRQTSIVSIDTDMERAVYLNSSNKSYVFPAKLSTPKRDIDFSNGHDSEDFSGIKNIQLELVTDGQTKKVPLPGLVLNGIAKYISTVRWADESSNCQSFAWTAHDIDGETEGMRPDFTELSTTDDLKAGGLVSVGSESNWMGLEFAKLRTMVHWGIYVDDGILLNVTGFKGLLAGTPINNLSEIYPDQNLYTVTTF